MGINIGNDNNFQGNINIANDISQNVDNMNQSINYSYLLEQLRTDIEKYYNNEDKKEVINNFDIFSKEISKPMKNRNPSFLKSLIKKLEIPFSIIANSSSIAGLIISIVQLFSS